MNQIVHVEFHRCGYLGEMRPPRCNNRCAAPMTLSGPNREPIADIRAITAWRWRCAKCKRPANRGVIRGCPMCRAGTVRVQPAEANQVFRPQYITVINPPSETDYRVLENAAVYPAAVAQSLGILTTGLNGLRNASNNMGSQAARATIRRTVAQLLGVDESDPANQEILSQQVEQMLSLRQVSSPGWEEAVANLGLDEETLEELGEECVSLTLAREAAPLTVADLQEHAPQGQLHTMYRTKYPQSLRKFGLAEVVLLREFPIAQIVAGYSREDSNPRNLDELNFMFFPAEGGPHPMYGQRVKTEALLFRLDPERVLHWLVRSGQIEEPQSERAAAWLFSRLCPVTNVFEPPSDYLTASVLGLTHSLSHRVIKALAGKTGLKAESLSEHIFPFNTAFLIYPSVRSDFVLGGLEYVYRNYLH